MKRNCIILLCSYLLSACVLNLPDEPYPSVPITDVIVSPTSIKLPVGSELRVTVRVVPENATGVYISWMYSGSNWGSGGEGLLPDVYAGNFEIIVFTPYVETGSLEITVTAPNWYSTQHIDVEVTIEGTTGDCVWTITGTADNYTLTIDGTGAMADYYSYDRPWEEYRNNIKTVVIQDGVRSIGEFAFGDCYGLTGSLTIPNSVTYIGNNAFRDCSGLTGSLTIGNSVTSIGDRAFLNCSGLTGSLTIGSSVTSISNYAFYGCSGFTGVTNLNPVPQSISSDDVFYGVPVSSLTLKVPSGSVAAYQAADVWRNFGSIQAIE